MTRIIIYAARTEFMNFATSCFSRLLSVDSDCAADSTCEEAPPASDAPRWTSAILASTCEVPSAARCTFREISWVAAPCSSTADAIVAEISDIRAMVAPISLIAVTESLVADWMSAICWLISSVAFAVCSAGARGFDRRVQRQKIGLSGNGLNQIDNIPDATGGLRQLADARVGLLGLFDRPTCDAHGRIDLAADFADRGCQLLARRRNRMDVRGSLSRSVRCALAELIDGIHGFGQGRGRRLELAGSRGDQRDDL